jgi:glyoxylase-like metal-dependent hydrolase (beta-lactamase superfamily II)
MLAYLNGDKIALAIDAGNSADHVDEFYNSLDTEGLRKPDFTVITHWHWDHTFGMHHIHGLSIAYIRPTDHAYIRFLKKDDVYLDREYADNKSIIVVPSDIQFKKELFINLGGITAKIFHTVSPHSEDTVLIYISEERILFLGDSTSEDFYNDGYMDTEKLAALTSLIESIDCKYCILGHADPLTKSDLLDYLKSIINL